MYSYDAKLHFQHYFSIHGSLEIVIICRVSAHDIWYNFICFVFFDEYKVQKSCIYLKYKSFVKL